MKVSDEEIEIFSKENSLRLSNFKDLLVSLDKKTLVNIVLSYFIESQIIKQKEEQDGKEKKSDEK
ncbi:MAG: hypothetical protein E7374_02885 [Clostridiales bacterium]|nr:hypothetical protein [Clostridiales bacterium]